MIAVARLRADHSDLARSGMPEGDAYARLISLPVLSERIRENLYYQSRCS
jgi:hypothetical protein